MSVIIQNLNSGIHAPTITRANLTPFNDNTFLPLGLGGSSGSTTAKVVISKVGNILAIQVVCDQFVITDVAVAQIDIPLPLSLASLQISDFDVNTFGQFGMSQCSLLYTPNGAFASNEFEVGYIGWINPAVQNPYSGKAFLAIQRVTLSTPNLPATTPTPVFPSGGVIGTSINASFFTIAKF